MNKYILDSSHVSKSKKLAYEFAKTNEINYPTSWNNKKMAGADWLASFLKRRKSLSLQMIRLKNNSE